MGILVVLENEDGERIEQIADPHNLLHLLLPNEDETRFPYLRNVDWYGNTTFNQLQAGDLIEELRLIVGRAKNGDQVELLEGIIRMTEKCRREVHHYLKFIGD